MKLFIVALAALCSLGYAGFPAKTSARDAGGEERDAFALKFLAAVQRGMPDAGLRYDPERFQIAGGGVEYNLYNAFSEYQRGGGTPERFAAKILALAAEKEQPGELLPAIRGRQLLEISANLRLRVQSDGGTAFSIPYEPVGDALGLAIVEDHPNAMAYFSLEAAAKVDGGFPAALATARRNLARHPRATLQPVGPGAYRVRSDEPDYATTSFFVGELFRKVKLKGAPVAIAVSNRATFVAGADDEAALATVAALAAEEAKTPRTWSPCAVRWTGSGWVPFAAPRGSRIAAGYARMRAEFLAESYAAQRELLMARLYALPPEQHTQLDEDAYPGELHGFKDKVTGEINTVAVLNEGVDSLLPEADEVFLVKGEQTIGAVPWARFLQVMGPKVKKTALWPPRYRARAFPTEAELKRLDPK